jgi:hypothetical protein
MFEVVLYVITTSAHNNNHHHHVRNKNIYEDVHLSRYFFPLRQRQTTETVTRYKTPSSISYSAFYRLSPLSCSISESTSATVNLFRHSLHGLWVFNMFFTPAAVPWIDHYASLKRLAASLPWEAAVSLLNVMAEHFICSVVVYCPKHNTTPGSHQISEGFAWEGLHQDRCWVNVKYTR